MKITADTNVLVRILLEDDLEQSSAAQNELAKAEAIALTLPTLCELGWVLSRGYKIKPEVIAGTIRLLIDNGNVFVDRPAVEAGLAILDSGGDFADGVIAYEGKRLGADLFLSFDKKAVKLLKARGVATRLLV